MAKRGKTAPKPAAPAGGAVPYGTHTSEAAPRSISRKKTARSPRTSPVVEAAHAAAPPPPAATAAQSRAAARQFSVMGLSLTQYAERNILGGDGVHDPWLARYGVQVPLGYRPRMDVKPVHVTRSASTGILDIKPYTAADYRRIGTPATADHIDVFTGAARRDRLIYPKFYQNPYQFQDYVYLQDIYANTIAGEIINMVVHFALADGVRPALRLRNEGQYATDEERQKVLDGYAWVIDEIREIERSISRAQSPRAFGPDDPAAGAPSEFPVGPLSTAADAPDTPTYDTSLYHKWFALMTNGLVFGRSMIVPRVDPDDNEVAVMEYGGGAMGGGSAGTVAKYVNIPKIMMIIHPRDMGFNFIDYNTHRLLGIQLHNASWIIRPNEMIFYENMPDNPVYGAKFYGMSGMQSMMGSARTLRRIIEVDFPIIAKTRWSGMYWLVFKRKGEDTSRSDEELARYLSNIQLNGINATLEDSPTEDFALHKVDLDPKIRDLLETIKELIKYMMGQVGMPEGLLYGEQDINRAILSAKIASWTKGSLKRYRQPFLDVVTYQFYGRLAKTLAAQSPKWAEAIAEIEVFATVDEFKLDSREQLLRSLVMLENVVGAFKDKARADFLEMDDLQSMIDPDKGPEDVPDLGGGAGGSGGKEYKVTEQESGKEFGVADV